MDEKNILILGRRDHTEAMRVAAGLTIFGHTVRIAFMSKPLAETQENADAAELLELSEIEPETTVNEMADDIEFLDADALAKAIKASDRVITI